MIDNPVQVERLLAALRASLPLPASIAPQSTTMIARQVPDVDARGSFRVTRADNAGDEGGIMCRLEQEGKEDAGLYISITHLSFDRKVPLAREIGAYQKHRINRLRRHGSV